LEQAAPGIPPFWKKATLLGSARLSYEQNKNMSVSKWFLPSNCLIGADARAATRAQLERNAL
jgi:hypothetical protein